MELHQLEYFRTLAHIKHFTNASKAIAVSQPALSRSIAKLEAELGVQLFDRSDKQLELTAEGKKFLFYVEGTTSIGFGPSYHYLLLPG